MTGAATSVAWTSDATTPEQLIPGAKARGLRKNQRQLSIRPDASSADATFSPCRRGPGADSSASAPNLPERVPDVASRHRCRIRANPVRNLREPAHELRACDDGQAARAARRESPPHHSRERADRRADALSAGAVWPLRSSKSRRNPQKSVGSWIRRCSSGRLSRRRRPVEDGAKCVPRSMCACARIASSFSSLRVRSLR